MATDFRFQRGEDIEIIATEMDGTAFTNPRCTLARYSPDKPVSSAPFTITTGAAPNVLVLIIPAATCAGLLPGFYRFNLAYDTAAGTEISDAWELELQDTTTL